MGLLKVSDRMMWTGQRLASYRRLAALTQEQLAEKVSCSVDTISRIERGVQDPSFQTVCSIEYWIGITPNDLCPADLLVTVNEDFENLPADLSGKDERFWVGIAVGKAVKEMCSKIQLHYTEHSLSGVRLQEFLLFCAVPRSRKEMMCFCNIKSSSHFRDYVLYPLLQQGILERTIPDKPSSPDQKYVLSIREIKHTPQNLREETSVEKIGESAVDK